MALVLLVRHAQGSWGADDYNVLSERGRVQSRALGVELRRRGLRPDVVVAGSMLRQRDTAAIALEEAGLDLEIEWDERWNEYDPEPILEHHVASQHAEGALAALRGGDRAALQRALDAGLSGWVSAGECPKCARPWSAFAAEVAAALDELLERVGSGGVAVVVSSGGPIAACCQRLVGAPPQSFVPLNRIMVNAAISNVISGRSGTSLLSMNDHGYLEAAADSLVSYR